jgi:diamine N-acetyltransferase
MKIHLRELSKTDLPLINSWRNDHAVIDLLGNNFLYIAKEVDENWYENYLQNRQQNIRLIIVDTAKDKSIGTVQLTNIHPINRSAEYSIMIGDKTYWGQGAGLEATKEILRHGFNDLHLNRIYLTVLVENTRAIKLYAKTGFIEEGREREAIFKNGRFHDLVLMSVLRKDFIN